MFRLLGLRLLAITNSKNQLVGVMTRNDFMGFLHDDTAAMEPQQFQSKEDENPRKSSTTASPLMVHTLPMTPTPDQASHTATVGNMALGPSALCESADTRL